MNTLIGIDLFCGAGGSSWGAREAGVTMRAGFDASELACQTYADNFPEALVFQERVENLSLPVVADAVGHVDIILASPECTNHSPAKGKAVRCEQSRRTAFHVIDFARKLQPRWVVIENVIHMKHWSGYPQLISGLRELGYHISEQIMDSADFGVPQRRRRLLILCDRNAPPPVVTPQASMQRIAADVILPNGHFPFSPLDNGRRAAATLERARRAMKALGDQTPFLLVYYGSDGPGGWQSLDQPLRTITTLDRFALVRPNNGHGHEMRMLQPVELRAAMGMPETFQLRHGIRRDRIRLVGNAVCPPVMEAVVQTLTGRQEGPVKLS